MDENNAMTEPEFKVGDDVYTFVLWVGVFPGKITDVRYDHDRAQWVYIVNSRSLAPTGYVFYTEQAAKMALLRDIHNEMLKIEKRVTQLIAAQLEAVKPYLQDLNNLRAYAQDPRGLLGLPAGDGFPPE